jgi:hypothetical protein
MAPIIQHCIETAVSAFAGRAETYYFRFACVVCGANSSCSCATLVSITNCTIAFPLLHSNHLLMQLTLGLPLYGIVRTDLAKELTLAWIVATAIMFVIPPFGWLRPHPYSDFRWNQQRKA